MKIDSHTNPDLYIKPFETTFILEKLFHISGYDFSQYARKFIERRLTHIMLKYHLNTYEEFINKLSEDPTFYKNVLYNLSISVTEPFRDPKVFLAIREKVIPLIRTYPFIRIWHAGCSIGEEVYSMAILLYEEGLLKRTEIYATEINEQILLRAKQGSFSFKRFQLFHKNYHSAGGKENLSKYFTETDGHFVANDLLKENIFFMLHNLASDQIINNVNMILCRNVFIYFNRELQQRILQHFCKSLVPRGVLCMGLQERLELIDKQHMFENMVDNLQIYQKKLRIYNYV